MIAVDSEMMDAVDYDAARCRLGIRFISGGWYWYAGVPRDVFEALLAAPSHGRFFHDHIRDRYAFRRG
ncbi:KTSC domain-containing protein [Sphingosinithalassobacter sp. CS137]|uniref:KTSC domain-containing protein n=1 Tax=Sphingosinithalassobacter sp. CS137 TaxID=2762748 RepID=UPI001CB6D791|nr:KTSC domain-containing protein [Sphingosinithalassobacter sp. CS137]